MTPIPKKIREQMSKDPFMLVCCMKNENCTGRIEWHHNLIFAGRQVQMAFAILPVCSGFHHAYANSKPVKEILNWIMLNRATDQELLNYSKAINYILMKQELNKKYSEWLPSYHIPMPVTE